MSTDSSVASRDSNAEPTDATADSREEIVTQVELLAEENRQLRESYTQAKRTQYRRTAFALGILGVLGVVAGFFLPGSRDLLLTLGTTGLFGCVLTLYLTPERFISADVGRDVYRALAANEASLVGELALTETRIYVPTSDSVRLFVPQQEAHTVPDPPQLADTIVVGDNPNTRGIALDPSGRHLYRSFEDAVTKTVAGTPLELAHQLTDALVGQFELVDSTSLELETDDQRLTVALNDSAYGPIDQFNHPVVSFLAVGLADGLDEMVAVEIAVPSNARAEYLLTYRWGDTLIEPE